MFSIIVHIKTGKIIGYCSPMDCISGYNSSYWMMLCVAILSLVSVIATLFLCYYTFIANSATTDAQKDSRMKTWIVVGTITAVFAMLFSIYGFIKINSLNSCVATTTTLGY